LSSIEIICLVSLALVGWKQQLPGVCLRIKQESSWGAGRETHAWKIFSPQKKYIGHSLKLLDIVEKI